jgi:hypothetical protein
MKLRYRGTEYKATQPNQIQQIGVASVTLTYRGNQYQRNQHQLMTQGIGSQRFMTNQSPQTNSWRTTTASARLIYRGVTYIS